MGTYGSIFLMSFKGEMHFKRKEERERERGGGERDT